MFSRFKKPILAIFGLAVGLSTTPSAQAYLVGTYGKDVVLNPASRTRVIVAARGSELVSLFQESAAAKAKKYRELYPNDQILFITVKEKAVNHDGKVINKSYDNLADIKEYGWSVKEKSVVVGFNPMQGYQYSDVLSADALINELAPYKQIASLDIYSHSTPTYGILLEGKWNRLDEDNKAVIKLKENFTEDAFVFLHGCNTGAAVAPYLSKVWGIPVAGSLTSTNSQRLFTDGMFYFDDDGAHPADVKEAILNKKITYQKNIGCYEGACVRMKPDNTPYHGYWGKFQDGLPFYKFFCVDVDDNKCKKTMARSLLSQISIKAIDANSSEEDFKVVLKDFICPANRKGNLQKQCMDTLDQISQNSGDETYNPFSGDQIQCDFNGCAIEYKCSEIPILNITIPESCQLINKATTKATTLVREFKNYMEGYTLMKAAKAK